MVIDSQSQSRLRRMTRRATSATENGLKSACMKWRKSWRKKWYSKTLWPTFSYPKPMRLALPSGMYVCSRYIRAYMNWWSMILHVLVKIHYDRYDDQIISQGVRRRAERERGYSGRFVQAESYQSDLWICEYLLIISNKYSLIYNYLASKYFN